MDAVAEKEKGKAFATLLLRALPLADTLEEAVEAVDAAMAMTNGKGVVPDVVQPGLVVDVVAAGAAFSFDIFNRRAQGVLNKAMKAVKEMSAAARRDLREAMKKDNPSTMAQAVVKFVQTYQTRLAELLGKTNLAALLEGAREVASKMPPVPLPGVGRPPPPSLPPDAAAALLSRLEAMSAAEQGEAIYQLPADQQEYIRRALSIGGSKPPLPPFSPPSPPEGSDEAVHYPTIEEAVKDLSARNVVSRGEYEQMDAATRQKAFTVARVEAQETLTKIRDALAENVAEGADYETFRAKVLAEVEPATFLSENHLETIWRTNIQSAFSDGQMTVLNHPFVREGFPFVSVDAIHDDRARPEHLEIEKIGIQGTNIFRTQDPVFQTFRAPWDFNCLLPGTLVSGRYQIGLKSFYAGETIEIVTASGARATVTANHPIATLRGMVPACEVEKGDYCIAYLGDVELRRNRTIPASACASGRRVSGRKMDHQYSPAVVEDVFHSLAMLGGPRKVRCGPSDLHGDARFGEGQIEIVGAYRELLLNRQPSFSNGSDNFAFPLVDVQESFVTGLGTFHAGLDCRLASSPGQTVLPRRFRHFGPLASPFHRHGLGWREQMQAGTPKMVGKRRGTYIHFGRERLDEFASQIAFVNRFEAVDLNRVEDSVLVSQGRVLFPKTALDFGESSHLYASIHERFGERFVADRSFTRELVDGFPSRVSPSKVIQIRKGHFRGHVYDLQGSPNLIIANGLLMGNCRCGWTPMTIQFAAEKGIKEAQQWLETGQEPSPPAFVPFPSFRPLPGFDRSLSAAPLSIRLSLLPLDLEASPPVAALAIETPDPEFAFGTEPPGPGWEYVGDMKWSRRDAMPSTPGEVVLIDVEAVAAMLDCSTSHVNRMTEDGLMPSPRKLGSLVRWSRKELLAWIEAGCPACEGKEEPPAEAPHVIY
jgi:excisionase family DNA binding protein